MTILTLTLLLTLVVVAMLALVFLWTERDIDRSDRPSVWRYGAAAYHRPLQLPPITRCTSSVPTGSVEPSHWPTSNAIRNRNTAH